jgi:hypothetical protein
MAVYDGLVFESFFDPVSNVDMLEQINYASWDTPLDLKPGQSIRTIRDHNGNCHNLDEVMYWFSDWFRVEIITWGYIEQYLNALEMVFSNISDEDLAFLGLPWQAENFPKNVRMPRLI